MGAYSQLQGYTKGLSVTKEIEEQGHCPGTAHPHQASLAELPVNNHQPPWAWMSAFAMYTP